MTGREFYVWQARDFTIRLALDVVDRLRAEYGADAEVGGILLGRVMGTGVIEISGYELFRSQHRRGVAYNLGIRERNRLTAHMQRLHGRRGDIPVGYFRTHLRPGLFLDQDDSAVLKEAFADPSRTALLISPGSGKAGFFCWDGDDMDRTRPALAFPFNSDSLREASPIINVPGEKKTSGRRIPAWQALAMAFIAAVAGFGIVSASTERIQVAVSVEADPSSPRGVLPARPYRPISPPVPDALAVRLLREVPVDLRVSIDRNGVVRNTKVLSGGGSAFSRLASNSAFRTAWAPARLGGESVPSEMIVHYRFRPASGERR